MMSLKTTNAQWVTYGPMINFVANDGQIAKNTIFVFTGSNVSVFNHKKCFQSIEGVVGFPGLT